MTDKTKSILIIILALIAVLLAGNLIRQHYQGPRFAPSDYQALARTYLSILDTQNKDKLAQLMDPQTTVYFRQQGLDAADVCMQFGLGFYPFAPRNSSVPFKVDFECKPYTQALIDSPDDQSNGNRLAYLSKGQPRYVLRIHGGRTFRQPGSKVTNQESVNWYVLLSQRNRRLYIVMPMPDTLEEIQHLKATVTNDEDR
jgi:hypothetical protein